MYHHVPALNNQCQNVNVKCLRGGLHLPGYQEHEDPDETGQCETTLGLTSDEWKEVGKGRLT